MPHAYLAIKQQFLDKGYPEKEAQGHAARIYNSSREGRKNPVGRHEKKRRGRPRVEVKTMRSGEYGVTRSNVQQAERDMLAQQHQVETQGYSVINEEGPFFGSLRRNNTSERFVKQGNTLYTYDPEGKVTKQVFF